MCSHRSLRHSEVVAVSSSHRLTLVMHTQHQRFSLFKALTEYLHKHLHHKIHRGEIIIKYNDVIALRLVISSPRPFPYSRFFFTHIGKYSKKIANSITFSHFFASSPHILTTTSTINNKKKNTNLTNPPNNISIRAIRAIRVLLTPHKQQSPQTLFVLFEILLSVSQWVYDKSRIRLSFHRQRPRSLIRAIRNIRVPLTTQAAESTGLIRAIRNITSRWSVGLRQISCSLNHTSSRAELGSIRVLRAIRVRSLTQSPDLRFYLNSLRIFSAISFISSASSFRCSLRKSTSASLCIGMR